MKRLFKLVLGLLLVYVVYRLLSELLRPTRITPQVQRRQGVWLPESPPSSPEPEPAPVSTPERVNLNQADAKALIALPGIGPALAERIIARREKIGPFGALGDLMQVQGIGPTLVARLRPLVAVHTDTKKN